MVFKLEQPQIEETKEMFKAFTDTLWNVEVCCLEDCALKNDTYAGTLISST